MMTRAEERFAELPNEADVGRYTYVIAPRIRWQAMLENPLCSFWGQLTFRWAGTQVEGPVKKEKQREMFKKERPLPQTLVRGRGRLVDDPETKAVYPVTI